LLVPSPPPDLAEPTAAERAAAQDRALEPLGNEVRRRRRRTLKRALMAADVAGLTVAFLLDELLFPSNTGGPHSIVLTTEIALFVATIPLWIGAADLYGLYRGDESVTGYSTVDDLVGVFHLIIVGTVALFVLGATTTIIEPDLHKIAVFWALAITLVTSGRVIARSLAHRGSRMRQNAIIVGTGTTGQLAARKFLRHRDARVNVVGFVDDEPRSLGEELSHLAILGSPEDLPELILEYDVERVVIPDRTPDTQTVELIRTLKYLDVQIDLIPALYEIVGSAVDLHHVGGLSLIGLPRARLSRTARFAKRTVDIVVSTLALVLLAPFFALVAVLIKLDSRGPVFFRQERMGARERIFHVLKFRTMGVDADRRKHEFAHLNVHHRNGDHPTMFKIDGDPRVTRVGRLLRRYFLDELPQLVNVLRGEMSLVGPRPLILEEDRQVAAWARRRLELRPGMTGLWQVLGRNTIPFEEMVQLDYSYVTTWSLAGDLRLLLRTIPLVVSGDGQNF
jgi:exopolysaccharide biosynthesis polyprenyl glycosylphosphotransferase